MKRRREPAGPPGSACMTVMATRSGLCGQKAVSWVEHRYDDGSKTVHGYCYHCSEVHARDVLRGGRNVPREEMLVMEVLDS